MVTMRKPVLAAALAATVALTAACGANSGRACQDAGSVLSRVESGVRHLAHAGSPGAGGRLERDCRKLMTLHDSVKHR